MWEMRKKKKMRKKMRKCKRKKKETYIVEVCRSPAVLYFAHA